MTTVQTLLEREGEKSRKTTLQGVEKTIFLERKCDTCCKHRKNHYIKAYTRERGGRVGVQIPYEGDRDALRKIRMTILGVDQVSILLRRYQRRTCPFRKRSLLFLRNFFDQLWRVFLLELPPPQRAPAQTSLCCREVQGGLLLFFLRYPAKASAEERAIRVKKENCNLDR